MGRKVCKRVHYWGHVQGVGFRYTTRGIAIRHTVAGYVRNLPNGQVELLVTGQSQAIDDFLDELNRRMAEYIEGHSIREEAVEDHEGFMIRT